MIGEPDAGCRHGTYPDCTPTPTPTGGTLPATGVDWTVAYFLGLGGVCVVLGVLTNRWNKAGR